MRKWKVVALLLVVSCAIAPLANAQQSNDDLKREVDALKRDFQAVLQRQAALERENDSLRTQVDNVSAVESNLEQMINTLSESDFAGTTVESVSNPISVFGEFRNRSGWSSNRDFGLNGNDDNGTYTDARYLVGFDFNFDRDVQARFSLQANGAFDNGNSDADAGNLDEVNMYEGWIQLNNLFGRAELSNKTGRQEIVLGNEFQFGNNDYFEGETFDASVWKWENDNFALNVIMAKISSNTNVPTSSNPTVNDFDDDELYSLYFTLKTIENHELDLYWIYFNGHGPGAQGTLGNNLGGAGAGDHHASHTIGGRIGGEFPSIAAGLDWNVEVAYQFGDNRDADLDTEGLAVEAEFGLTFDTDYNFRVFIRFLYAEGADGDDTGYIPLFTERHAQAGSGGTTNYRARYGLLDVIPMQNVVTGQLGATFDPAKDWTVGLTVLYAENDEDNVNGDDEIGFEIDLFAEYRYSDQTTLSGGLGVFFPDDAADNGNGGFAGNDDDAHFLFYVQARIVF